MHTRGNTLLLIEVSCLSVLIDKGMPYQGLLVFMKFIQLHGVGSEIIHLNEIKYGAWPSDIQAKAYYHFSSGRGVFCCLSRNIVKAFPLIKTLNWRKVKWTPYEVDLRLLTSLTRTTTPTTQLRLLLETVPFTTRLDLKSPISLRCTRSLVRVLFPQASPLVSFPHNSHCLVFSACRPWHLQREGTQSTLKLLQLFQRSKGLPTTSLDEMALLSTHPLPLRTC